MKSGSINRRKVNKKSLRNDRDYGIIRDFKTAILNMFSDLKRNMNTIKSQNYIKE